MGDSSPKDKLKKQKKKDDDKASAAKKAQSDKDAKAAKVPPKK